MSYCKTCGAKTWRPSLSMHATKGRLTERIVNEMARRNPRKRSIWLNPMGLADILRGKSYQSREYTFGVGDEADRPFVLMLNGRNYSVRLVNDVPRREAWFGAS
jgi:hypothetical protein